MSVEEAQNLIIQSVRETLSMKGLATPSIESHTALLGGALPIDSLDLAAIVIQISETSGKDPFAAGFVEFRTVEELARLYAD